MTQAALAENQSSVTRTWIHLKLLFQGIICLFLILQMYTHTHFKIAKQRGINYKVATRTGNKTLQFH